MFLSYVPAFSPPGSRTQSEHRKEPTAPAPAMGRPGMGHSRVPDATGSGAALGAGTSITTVHLHDQRKGERHRVKHAPTVHVARGYEHHLPFLSAGRPLICLADWQVEPATQRHFWEQALLALTSELGDSVARAIVLVAGDMASAGDDLRGSKSDSVPDLDWLFDCFVDGDVYFVYGNHDLTDDKHLALRSPCSGLPSLLPHGAALRVPLMHVPGTAPATVGRAESDGCAALVGAESTNNLVRSEQASGAEPVQAHEREEEKEPPSIQQEPGEECHPTAEQLAGLNKKERAALWAACASDEKRAGTAPSKLERPPRQPRQRASRTQWPGEAQLEARLSQLHAGSPALLSTVAASTAARGAAELRPPAGAAIVVAAVHGIPASYTQGLRKLERDDYFRAVDAALCTRPVDVLVTHANAKLPELHDEVVRDEDAPRLYDAFLRSSASLHVHGHMHTEPVVAVVAPGKVVVNADCRVVAFAAASL